MILGTGMDVIVTLASAPELQPWRERYRAETRGQIVHDSLHGRTGWTQSFLVRMGPVVAGYGSIAVAGPWKGKPTVFEFFLAAEFRTQAFALFEAFATASGARHFEVQTNDLLLTTLLHTYGRDTAAEKIVFEDRVRTAHAAQGAVLRRTSIPEEERRAIAQRQGGSEWILELEGRQIGKGGILFHYNVPYGDIYFEIAEPCRRKGFGAFFVQELKRATYELGAVPAARCNFDNVASRQTMQKAGFVPCGAILLARLP
jgi:GNAT superfamily N-acetyltransferase